MYSSLVKVEILVGPPNVKNQLLELPFENRPPYYNWSETIPETGSRNFAFVSLGTVFVQIGQAAHLPSGSHSATKDFRDSFIKCSLGCGGSMPRDQASVIYLMVHVFKFVFYI